MLKAYLSSANEVQVQGSSRQAGPSSALDLSIGTADRALSTLRCPADRDYDTGRYIADAATVQPEGKSFDQRSLYPPVGPKIIRFKDNGAPLSGSKYWKMSPERPEYRVVWLRRDTDTHDSVCRCLLLIC